MCGRRLVSFLPSPIGGVFVCYFACSQGLVVLGCLKASCLRIPFYAKRKDDVERNSLLTTTTMAGNAVAAEEKKGKTVKAALYGVQVFYSFFIM